MEVKRIANQLKRSLYGEAWHGPPVMELLSGVTAERAAARPIAAAHTIWEITLHIGTWMRVVRQRLDGQPVEPTPEEDWPAVRTTSPEAWKRAVADLDEVGKALEARIRELREEQLSDRVPGEEYNVYFMLHGVVQHNLYHAGQIAVLRK